MRRDNSEIVQKREKSNTLFFDILTKLDYIKANGIAEELDRIYRAKNIDIYREKKKLYSKNIYLQFIQFVLEHGIKVIVPVIGAMMMANGEITPGGVAVATSIFSSFLVPSLFQIMGIYKDVMSSKDIIKKVMAMTENEEYSVERHRNEVEERTLAIIKNVSYSHDNRKVLNNLSLTIPYKGCIAISGKSGTGKSTLGKIIAGLLYPEQGEIVYNSMYFDTNNINEKVAYMDNDAFFIEDKLEQNVKCGGKYWEKAIEFLRLSNFQADNFKIKDIVLRENGENLSGGQKQLLAFARVLAKDNAQLIILDEPTSSLDEESRKRVYEFINLLAEEKCIIVFTHDKELLQMVREKYVVEDGRLCRV